MLPWAHWFSASWRFAVQVSLNHLTSVYSSIRGPILQHDSRGLLVEVLAAVLAGAVPSQCSLASLRPSRHDWECGLVTARVFTVYVNVSYHFTLLRLSQLIQSMWVLLCATPSSSQLIGDARNKHGDLVCFSFDGDQIETHPSGLPAGPLRHCTRP